MARVALLVLALALAGCGKLEWEKPGVTTADAKMAAYECDRDMRMSGGPVLMGALGANGMYQRCMDAKGYTLVRK